jgi:two-component system, chemotaxis family, protein-glutamate methylesterase/glutaminase
MTIRVLVVDDSAFARKVMREVLQSSPEIEVVGVARDGLEALERIALLAPDVVTLDLVMPNLDGLGVLEALPEASRPRFIIVSTSDSESELGVRALQAGAIELLHKPTALATEQLYELRDELVRKVKAAAAARTPSPRPVPPTPLRVPPHRARVVAVGTSTGGPQALTRLLKAMPADFPAPIVIALHIPAGYTHELAKRLHDASAIDVEEASDGLELRPGLAIIARGGIHLTVVRRGDTALARLVEEPRSAAHAPSVDVLFGSAAEAFGAATLGVVLTGMGDDGLLGSRSIHEAGGQILTQTEESCVVYGMPRCVDEAGLSAAQASIEEMPGEIIRHL